MKLLKTLKYAVAFSIFVVLTSFQSVDKFSKVESGEAQIEILVIND